MEKSKCCGYDGIINIKNETTYPLILNYDQCAHCKTILTLRIQKRTQQEDNENE